MKLSEVENFVEPFFLHKSTCSCGGNLILNLKLFYLKEGFKVNEGTEEDRDIWRGKVLLSLVWNLALMRIPR